MDYQVSARKYRPGVFQDVIGQSHVVQTLMNAIGTKRIAHAFLFSGSRGVGKTTIARILAKALNCERGPTSEPCGTCANCLEIAGGTSVDVIEIDGASNTSVDDVREIRENIKFAPFRGQYRVYIIDEVHMLSNSAFNALLKTLEEPPAHVVFVFATTEIHKIPATILSRCQHYNFRRIPRTEIMARLRYVAEQDGLHIEDRSLAAIARASEGSMRDALSLLDQAVSFSGKAINHDAIAGLLGSVPQELVRDVMAAIIQHDSRSAVHVIARLLNQGHDLRAFCSDLVEHVRNLLVASVVAEDQGLPALRALVDVSDEELLQLRSDAAMLTIDQLQTMFRIFSEAEDGLRASMRPRFVLEMAVIRAARVPNTAPVAVAHSATPEAAPTRSVGEQNKSRPAAPSHAGGSATPRATPAVNAPRRSTGATEFHATPHVGPLASQTTPAAKRVRGSGTSEPVAGPPSQRGEPPVSPDTTATRRDPEVLSHSAKTALSWEQVVECIEQRHPHIGPFLAKGGFLGVEGNIVTVGYPRTASIALGRVQKEDSLQAISHVCSEVGGRPLQVRVVELNDDAAAALSVAELRAEKERSQKSALLEQTRSHPLVKQALAMFGGDVVEVRVTKPGQEECSL